MNCQTEVTVTVQNNQVTIEVKPKSSGSFDGWGLLMLVAFAGRL
ncbi:hypothetical protein [Rheinheimera sediminis]|nr:hypothetical protein [Rheinheimera sp. YQF-1]